MSYSKGRHGLPMLVMLVLLFVFVGCDDSPDYPALTGGTVVLAFGDSVTYGTGAGQGQSYPVRLAQRSGWEITNAGVPGDTAAAAKSRIEALLQKTVPRVVIVELGGNDFLRRRPENEVKGDLRIILRQVKAYGAIPVLIGVPELSILRATLGNLSDSNIYAELANEEGVLLVKDVLSAVLSDASLRADRIHPNAEGYRVLANGIADALADAGLLGREQ